MPGQITDALSFASEGWRGLITFGVSAGAILLGQASDMPAGIGGIAQALGVTGALIWFLHHLVTKTIPKILEKQDELVEAFRADKSELTKEIGAKIDGVVDSVNSLKKD